MFQIMIFKIPTFILAKLSENGGKELPLKSVKEKQKKADDMQKLLLFVR